MATKKQKREQGAARQELFAQQSIQSGLKAQARDRARREKKAKQLEEQKNHERATKAVREMAINLGLSSDAELDEMLDVATRDTASV